MTKLFGSNRDLSVTGLWTVGAGLLALQIPFILTKHIQEDAYITFRCAVNLATTGVYGFNPGERVSASTAHLSVFIIALLRWLSGDAFIRVVQVTYGAATIVGTYFIVSAIVAKRRAQTWVWVAVSILPVSLLIGYGGMETALVIVLYGVILRYALDGSVNAWCAAAFFFLPWSRPDAIAVGAIVLLVSVWPGRVPARTIVVYGAWLAAGISSWALFNQIYFGAVFTQTILGKAAVWMPSPADDVIGRGWHTLLRIVVGDGGMPGLFVPIETKFLHWLAIPSFVVSLAAAVITCTSPERTGARRAPVLALALTAFLLPVAYAVGGVVASWYFWPSRLSAFVLITVAVASWIERQSADVKKWAASVAVTVVVLLAIGQWCFAIAWGTQERLYRGGIGEQIHGLSTPDDTLLLEPAGYIPFYAQRWTWDEIGVTTPAVTRYRRSYGQRWWIEFVKDISPTFVLEREPMRAHVTLDGYRLTHDEASWFDEHYVLIRTFTYQPKSLRSSPLLARIASFSSATGYLLYRRVLSSGAAAMKTNHAANVP